MFSIQPPVPENLLSAWYVLEMLAPQKLPSVEDLRAFKQVYHDFDENTEIAPWLDPSNGPKGKEKGIHWMIVLGICDVGRITKDLLEKFKDTDSDEKDYPVESDEGAAVVLKIDEKGMLSKEGVFLAAYPWAAGKLLNDRIEELSEFADCAEKIQDELYDLLIKQDGKGQVLPLDATVLEEAFLRLKEILKLNDDHFTCSGTAIRVPHQLKEGNVNEPFFLNNSFYLKDLQKVLWAVQKKEVKSAGALGKYLSGKPEGDRIDVLNDSSILKTTLTPQCYPLARWPGKRIGVSEDSSGFRPSLALMQQFGINRMVKDLKKEGIFSVNGPPGTGKTTLLRDLVAAVMFKRAEAMVTFGDPNKAFSFATKLEEGNTQNFIYSLDSSLQGHEILVASSNNSAVENISRELPQASSIADDLNHALEYFKAIAENVANQGGRDDHDSKQTEAVWGLAAAVLGKSGNRSTFAEAFWWDKNLGFEKLLWQNGDDKEQDSKKPWEEVREDFLKLKASVENDIKLLQHAADSIEKIDRLIEEKYSLERSFEEFGKQQANVELELDETHILLTDLEKSLEEIENLKKDHEDSKPKLWKAIWILVCFFTSARVSPWIEWEKTNKELFNEKKATTQKLTKSRGDASKLRNERNRLGGQIEDCHRKIQSITQEIEQEKQLQAEARELAGEHFADAEYWSQSRNELQKTNPWLGMITQERRDELFAAAWRVHEAFIWEARSRIRSNLKVFFTKTFKGQLFDKETPELVANLWSTFSLVVPVFSSTFASIETMFKNVGPNSIGWLCIDEAGQAVPAHAVGAIWRSNRVVVVGDPLQIPPVVVIPEELKLEVCGRFNVDANTWVAPKTSTQTLADRANRYGTVLSETKGDTWVGSPLLVHRRCDDPMFKIANQIAYQNLMVQGKPNANPSVEHTLGESCWFDTTVAGSDKWNPNDGLCLLQKLALLQLSGVTGEDIFIIAAFRRVVQGLKEMLRSKGDPFGLVKANRVGTVHTAQGKESKIVFFVLGASNEDHLGARNWATQEPNLLNVALTRAKKHIYVIGNHDAWKNHGCVKEMAKQLNTLRS